MKNHRSSPKHLCFVHLCKSSVIDQAHREVSGFGQGAFPAQAAYFVALGCLASITWKFYNANQ